MPGADPYSAAVMGGIQIWSGVQQAQMIRQGAELQSKIDELNAEYTEYDAWQAEKYGSQQAAHEETKNQQVIGSEKVANAVNNVDSTFGTAKQLGEQSKLNGFLNVLDIKQAAHAKAMGLERDAQNIRLGIGQNELKAASQASSAQLQGLLGAAETAGKYVAGKYGYSSGRGKPDKPTP